MNTLEGYCENGIHYIGHSDSCWRCEAWEVANTEARIFYAARDAYALAASLQERDTDAA